MRRFVPLLMAVLLCLPILLAAPAVAHEGKTVTIPAPPGGDEGFASSAAETKIELSLSDAQEYAHDTRIALGKQAFDDIPMIEYGVLANLFTGESIGSDLGANVSLKILLIPDSVPTLGNRALFVTGIAVFDGFGVGADVSLNRMDQDDNGLRVGGAYINNDGEHEGAVYLRKAIDFSGLF